MIVKNITKLIQSNFGTFLKSLAYQIVVLGVAVLLCLPFFDVLSESYGSAFSNAYSYASSGLVLGGWNGFMVMMQTVVFGLVDGTVALFSANSLIGVYIFVFVLVLTEFLFNIIRLVISESLYGYMSSLSKPKFFQSLFKHLIRALKYSFWRTLLGFLFYSAIFAGLAGLMLLPDTVYGAMPVIVVLYLGITLTVRELLFAGIAPAMIVYNYGIRKSVVKGLKVTSKNIWQIWLYITMVSIGFTSLAVLLSAYSLIIIVPLCVYIYSVAEMLYFFEAQGMRYYINMEQIVAPKKLEERDDIKKAKYII